MITDLARMVRRGTAVTAPERIRANRSASRAAETKRALAKNWALFERWCRANRVQPLPAAPEDVEVFLLYLAEDHPVQDRKGRVSRLGLRPSSIEQALWAINTTHRFAGHFPPGDHESVRIALAGIKRRKGTRQKQQAPLTIEHLSAVRFPETLKGLRDKALLLVGFAGCFRRSELVSLLAEDVEETAYGVRILLRRSKTDQTGQGTWVDIVRASTHVGACPVVALRAWLSASQITQGALFRSVGRGSNPRIGPALSAVSVDAIVKQAAKACGLNPSAYGGHSLRAGYATYLAKLNKSPVLIARHGRWKSVDMVLRYARDEVVRGLVGSY
jgi:site-specific recombinase XerD